MTTAVSGGITSVESCGTISLLSDGIIGITVSPLSGGMTAPVSGGVAMPEVSPPFSLPPDVTALLSSLPQAKFNITAKANAETADVKTPNFFIMSSKNKKIEKKKYCKHQQKRNRSNVRLKYAIYNITQNAPRRKIFYLIMIADISR
jgi:hypothetical protein